MKPTINLNGKEYIQYLKYKDEKSKQRWKAFDKGFKQNQTLIVTSIALLCITALFVMIFQYITYEEPVRTAYTWAGILKFLAIATGIGWIVHGVGFTIIGKLS